MNPKSQIEASAIEVGQVYRDKDPRMVGRHIVVIDVNGGANHDKAICMPCTPEGRRISRSGMTTHNPANLSKRFTLIEKPTVSGRIRHHEGPPESG